MSELLEPEESHLENINLDERQTVGHSSLQAKGTATYKGEEYDLAVTETGKSIRIRASSEDRVYLGSIEQDLSRDEFDSRIEEIISNADLNLAYSTEETTGYDGRV